MKANRIGITALLAALLWLSARSGGSGGSGGGNNGGQDQDSSNWDEMVWDRDDWA